MERLTSREPRVSGVPGVCCTHFEGSDCQAIQGRCADGCLWEEAAWDRLAAYEDSRLTPEEIMILCSMDRRAKMAELLRMEENKPLALEQLMEMDGEPVFLTPIQSACTNDKQGAWALVDLNQRMCRVSGGGLAVFENCGKTWMAYRYRPQE